VAIVFGVAMLFVVGYNVWRALTESGHDDELVLTQDLGDRIEEKMAQVAAEDPASDSAKDSDEDAPERKQP
jgi:hypothetical protein